MGSETKITPHILIVEARFYPEISDQLAKGATAALSKSGATFERVQVPGAMEIPAAIRFAVKNMEMFGGADRFHGFVALGCVIRGETDHYEHVCRSCLGGIQALAGEYTLAIGSGVLTVENMKQAFERAAPDKRNKGGAAAMVCLDMLQVKDRFGLLRA